MNIQLTLTKKNSNYNDSFYHFIVLAQLTGAQLKRSPPKDVQRTKFECILHNEQCALENIFES